MQACLMVMRLFCLQNGNVNENGTNLDSKLEYDLVVTTTGNINVLISLC